MKRSKLIDNAMSAIVEQIGLFSDALNEKEDWNEEDFELNGCIIKLDEVYSELLALWNKAKEDEEE